jgi:hypothetical protein
MKRKNKPTLAIEHARELAGKVEWEGDILYVIENWGSGYIKEFKDKKFTSLVKAFRKAAEDLKEYCHLERVEDEQQDEIDAEEGYEAEKAEEGDAEDIPCEFCGDTLDENGECATCPTA